jgi:hypothetical protein
LVSVNLAGGLLLLLLAILLLPLLPVQTRINYQGGDQGHALRLRIGLFSYRIGVGTSLAQGQKEGADSPQRQSGDSPLSRLSSLLADRKRWPGGLRIIRRLLSKSVCRRLVWETAIGFDDYALTGAATGLLWSGKGMAVAWLGRLLSLDGAELKLDVRPSFGAAAFHCSLDCILETRLGHIMIGLVRIVIWRWKK